MFPRAYFAAAFFAGTYFPPPGAAGTYVLAAGPGSYSLTGQNVALLWSGGFPRLVADPGTFGLSGSPAGLLLARKVDAAGGSLSLSGAAATFPRTYVLDATASASYSVSSPAASLLLGRLLGSPGGSYQLVGAASLLRHGRTVLSSPGVFTLVGEDVALRKTLHLDAESGTLSWTGTEAGLFARAFRPVSRPGWDPFGAEPPPSDHGAILTETLSGIKLTLSETRSILTLSRHAAVLVFAPPAVEAEAGGVKLSPSRSVAVVVASRSEALPTASRTTVLLSGSGVGNRAIISGSRHLAALRGVVT